jgi:hypothetical protein
MRTEWACERGKLKPASTCDVSAPRSGGTRIHRIVHICLVALVCLVAFALCTVAAAPSARTGTPPPLRRRSPISPSTPWSKATITPRSRSNSSAARRSPRLMVNAAPPTSGLRPPAVVLRAAARQGRLLGHLVRTRQRRIHQAGCPTVVGRQGQSARFSTAAGRAKDRARERDGVRRERQRVVPVMRATTVPITSC